jgi:hypothetical protein
VKPRDPRTARATAKAFLDLINPLREAARHMGYALAVHGSLARDIDLVAVPWTAAALSPDLLVPALVHVVRDRLGFAHCDLRGEAGRPHGRRAWTIHFHGGSYIDLSVLPRAAGP